MKILATMLVSLVLLTGCNKEVFLTLDTDSRVISISDDEKYLVYSKNNDLLFREIDTGVEVHILTGNNFNKFAVSNIWSPQNKAIVIAQKIKPHYYRFLVYNISTKEKLEVGYGHRFVWSDDEEGFLLVNEDLVSKKGYLSSIGTWLDFNSNQQVIPLEKSPNSKYFSARLVSNQTEKLAILDNYGDILVELDADSWDPVWSPNSRFLVYSSRSQTEGGVWVYDTSKNQKTLVSKRISSSFNWSPNSTKLSISNPDELSLYSIDKQKEIRVNVPEGFSVSPKVNYWVDEENLLCLIYKEWGLGSKQESLILISSEGEVESKFSLRSQHIWSHWWSNKKQTFYYTLRDDEEEKVYKKKFSLKTRESER